ncbi:MAG TPA: permease, partial [Nitrososphaeraceae archaeon]|nr:permease [Nitrososphaeraceae archaeon]
MIPLFTSVLYSGAGIGPAISFLLLAPSSNILAVLLTGDLLSWELAAVRIISSIAVALAAGIIVSKTPWGKAIEREHQIPVSRQTTAVSLAKIPLDDKLWAALKFAAYLAKMILPYFIIGLVAVSYFQAYFPEDIISHYLTGTVGVLIASVIGGPLYTPTLVEIVVGRGLVDLGMSKGPLLSWLMGQPYDVVNAIAVSRITRWKVVLTYMAVAWMGSVISGLVYGTLTRGL